MQALIPREYDDLLSNKPINLSAAGTRTSDLYYSVQNSSVEVLESTCNWSNVVSLTSRQFGANNQTNLPMSAFVGQLILHLRLPNVVVNQTLCRGWGLRMIRAIRFQFGSSATAPILLTRQAIVHALMSQCHTEEKRSEMLKLCGEEYLAVPSQPSGGLAVTTDAYVPIPIPFSTVCEKLMYDTTILGQPIAIFIDFEQNARSVYGGSATMPTEFLTAELLIRQQQLSDQSKSLRNIMNLDPTVMYAYPFILSQGYETPQFPGKISGMKCSVQLNQFQNSDLLGIVLSVQRVADVSPSGSNSPNPFHLSELSDVEVTYNGGMIFQLPAKSYKACATYMGDQQASYYQGSVIAAGTTAPFVSAPANEYLLFLDFTQIRSACMQDHLFNSWRIPPGNVLNFNFYTELEDVNYIAYYTCFYNGIVQAQGGTAMVLTA